ncbi:hypothetical protein pb186bvf_018703 [Paramecium bursaria]
MNQKKIKIKNYIQYYNFYSLHQIFKFFSQKFIVIFFFSPNYYRPTMIESQLNGLVFNGKIMPIEIILLRQFIVQSYDGLKYFQIVENISYFVHQDFKMHCYHKLLLIQFHKYLHQNYLKMSLFVKILYNNCYVLLNREIYQYKSKSTSKLVYKSAFVLLHIFFF